LGVDRSDEHRHYAGDVHLRIGNGHNEREPGRNDYLHPDRDQRGRVNDVDGNCYRHHVEQTGNQFLHGESHKHHVGFEQHIELDDDRGHRPCHHAGKLHVHFCQRINEREPNRDDNLHTDCDQQFWLDHIHRKSYGDRVWRCVDNHHDFMPWRNAGSGLHGLHHRRDWRNAALHIFSQHELQLSSVA
jgi:hypothetical protein